MIGNDGNTINGNNPTTAPAQAFVPRFVNLTDAEIDGLTIVKLKEELSN